MTEPNFEPFELSFQADFLAHCARLRAQDAVYRSPQGYWVLTRHADIANVMADGVRYSNALGGQETMGLNKQIDDSIPIEALNEGLQTDLRELMSALMIVTTDNPRHSELRRVVNRAFLPARVAQWRERVERISAELLAEVRPDAGWEVVSTLAAPLPLAVLCEILGVPRARGADLKRWADTVINSGSGDARNSRESLMRTLQAMREFCLYFEPLLAERRLNPGTDVISDLVRAEEVETLSIVDTLMFILALVVAGHESTAASIGNMVINLLEHPEQLARLQNEPKLLGNAVEESLRYRSTVQFLFRTPFVDTSCCGQLIRAGEPICIVMASANRDPDKYPDPDRFDIGRDVKGHLAFGIGMHFCLGAALARIEIPTAIGALLPHLHRWRLAEGRPPVRIPANLVHAHQRIELVPAAIN
jgi:cytochrome P450